MAQGVLRSARPWDWLKTLISLGKTGCWGKDGKQGLSLPEDGKAHTGKQLHTLLLVQVKELGPLGTQRNCFIGLTASFVAV